MADEQAGVVGWVVAAECYRSLVVWSASSASWAENPARGSPRQFRALKCLNMARAAAARRCLESTTETAASSPGGDDAQVIGGRVEEEELANCRAAWHHVFYL